MSEDKKMENMEVRKRVSKKELLGKLTNDLLHSLPKEVFDEMTDNLIETGTMKEQKLGKLYERLSKRINRIVKERLFARLLERVTNEKLKLIELETNSTNLLADVNRQIVWKEVLIQKLSQKIKELQQMKDKPRVVEEAQGQEEEEPKLAEYILPEDCWEKVFSQLSDSRDLKRCMDTCQLFQRMLIPRETVFLFGQVFEHLYDFMDKQDVLNCRLVCKMWSTGVDRFFENHPSLGPYNTDTIPDSNSNYPAIATPRVANYFYCSMLEDSLRTNEFLERMHDHPRNPFIGRAFQLFEYSSRSASPVSLGEYWAAVYKFLAVFGQHIWYFSLSSTCINRVGDTSAGASDRKTATFIAKDMLKLLPNLRKLFIDDLLTSSHGRLKVRSEFFEVPSLETLQIDEINNEFETSNLIIGDMVIAYQNQIKRLHMTPFHWTNFSTYGWYNLAELHIGNIKRSAEMEVLQELKLPKLKRLGLSFHDNGWRHESTDFDNAPAVLFKILKILCATTDLTILRLGGLIAFPDKEIFKLSPDLWAPPTLKTIEMEHRSEHGPRTRYSFLLRFPLLENLHIFLRQQEWVDGFVPVRRNTSEIRFLDGWRHIHFTRDEGMKTEMLAEIMQVSRNIYHRELYCTRLWNYLSKLNVVTFQGKVFTREGYFTFIASNDGWSDE